MTNEDIRRIAMEQSARELNCVPEDFLKADPVITRGGLGAGARRYYREPIACNFVSYGGNVVASVQDQYRSIVEEYLGKFVYYHCFETPNMHWLDKRLELLGQKVCFMAEYFLPDVTKLKEQPCAYRTALMGPKDFSSLYLPQWSNALCADRKDADVLGIGAFDGERLIGLAACSADCDTMWQIGVDVLPEYRRQGIAVALTSALAAEILRCGRVPFYCCAWSNMLSARNAVRSGFLPAWAEMTVKPSKLTEDMNKG